MVRRVLARGIHLACLGLVVGLVAPTAGATPASDPGLLAAVAPVQTVFDGAAREVQLAITESTRDGTPDAARALHADLLAFVEGLGEDRSIASSASYREAALAALPAALSVAATLANLTEDIARLSTSGETCSHRVLTSTERADLEGSLASIQATGRALAQLAQQAPEGVDGRPLLDAAERLTTWSMPFQGFEGCTFMDADAPGAPPFLKVDLRPAVAWPTRAVQVRGVTSVGGPVRITAPALGWEGEAARDPDGSFRVTFTVPRSTQDGAFPVRAHVGNLTGMVNLTVIRAPSSLDVTGPLHSRIGGNVTVQIRLSSPLQEEIAKARILVDNGARPSVALANGTATLQLGLPREPGPLEVAFRFPGTGLVAGDETTYSVVVGEEPEGEEFAPPEKVDDPLLAYSLLTAFLLAFLSASWIVAMVRARRPPRLASRGPASPPPATSRAPRARALSSAETPPRTLVEVFSGLVRALRTARLVRPSMTAREMQPTLSRLGFELEDLVPAFEAARYGDRPEPTSWTRRLVAWTERARRRLREVAP